MPLPVKLAILPGIVENLFQPGTNILLREILPSANLSKHLVWNIQFFCRDLNVHRQNSGERAWVPPAAVKVIPYLLLAPETRELNCGLQANDESGSNQAKLNIAEI